jgi:phage FluMu protein gp41
MTTITVTLDEGLRIGDDQYTEAEICALKSGDILDANLEAEKLELVPDLNGAGEVMGYKPEFVKSPTLVFMHALRRRVSIGPLKAPLDIEQLRLLSPKDMDILQRHADLFDNASLEVAQRGRTHTESSADRDSDQ